MRPSGSARGLKATFASRPILEVRTAEPVRAMRTLDAMPAVEKTSIFGTAVHAVLHSRETTAESVAGALEASGVAVAGCAVVQPSLEDVFLDVAERGAA